MKIKRFLSMTIFLLLILSLTACQAFGSSQPILASGTIDVDTVRVAPEISGKVREIKVEKGSEVKAGDILFILDDELLKAQHERASASVKAAEAALDAARQNLETVKTQYQLALNTARSQAGNAESDRWKNSVLSEIDLPNWYFQKSEDIAAYESDVQDAQLALEDELNNLRKVLQDASNLDFVEAEKRLNLAQTAFQTADETDTQANAGTGSDKTELVDASQKLYDKAKSELDSAQKNYDDLLTTRAADDVLEARARVSIAKSRLENSQDALIQLLTRDQSLEVDSAKSTMTAAQISVTQSEANLSSAQAALKELEVQLSKTVVKSPVSGVVLANPVKEGETVAFGATVVEIGPLDKVTLTVYIPENLYGRVQLGQNASITVDSFPGQTFNGQVMYISDQAEFTPRTVQTVESRSTTVYKVEISLPNPDRNLKPGMPADAKFE